MQSRLKGAFFATMAFGFLALAYVIFRIGWFSAGTHAGTVGTDVGVVALWTVRRPLFWVVFLVALAAGSEFVHYREGLFRPGAETAGRVRRALPWILKGTLIGLTTFILGSFAYLITHIGHEITSGSPVLWAFLASMAFGCYVARSSGRYVWILKGAFFGFVALFPIFAFYLIIRESIAESTRTYRTPHELSVASPLFWFVLAVTIAWACYISKPQRESRS